MKIRAKNKRLSDDYVLYGETTDSQLVISTDDFSAPVDMGTQNNLETNGWEFDFGEFASEPKRKRSGKKDKSGNSIYDPNFEA